MENTDSLYNIAIIGMAGRFPGAANVNEFWQNLSQGAESIATLDNETLLAAGVPPQLLQDPHYVKAKGVLADADCFDARFFKINPHEAALMDPQQRLFLECAWHALEDAGHTPDRFNGRVGIYAGSNLNTYLLRNILAHPDYSNSYQAVISNDKDFITTQVAYRLNLRGPAVTVQTACSTSLVAVHLACQSLLNWECDMALAGGSAVTVPLASGYLYEEGGVTSPDGHCRAFSADAQGTVGGNGVGIVVLKRLSDALADGDSILAVIKGSAINNDGSRKIGYTAPGEDGQVEVIAEALAIANVPADSIGYIEAHGTGTLLGDPIEVAALNRAFRLQTDAQQFCYLGSVKSNIGHLDAAAGIAGLIKTVLSLHHRQIPPHRYAHRLNPHIEFANSPFLLSSELQAWPAKDHPRRAGVSSFGIGGTNAHIILEEAPAQAQSSPTPHEQLVLLSAKTTQSLDTLTAGLADHLRQHPGLNLADAAYTLQVGRQHFEQRRALLCHTVSDAISALEAPDTGRLLSATAPDAPPGLVFMFPGQGAQYVNMGRDLYEHIALFQDVLDQCADLLKPTLGINLLDVLYPPVEKEAAAVEQLKQTALAQPALFAVEYALATVWRTWGVTPKAMIGHSLGEYVAACLAGVFTLEDALAIVAKRGQLMQQLPAGAMLAVFLPAPAVHPFLHEELSLAAVNRLDLSVVSGTETAVTALQVQLAQQNIQCRRLYTSHAFHSQMMEPIQEEFATYVAQFERHAPQIPIISNTTGRWLTTTEAINPAYWSNHLRQPVQFAASVQTAAADTTPLFLEVGPGNTLRSFTKQHLSVASLPHPQEKTADTTFLQTAVARLWLAGQTLDWEKMHDAGKRRHVSLPGYAFERKRHWILPHVSATPQKQSAKRANIHEWLYLPTWQPTNLPTPDLPPTNWLILTDHTQIEQALASWLDEIGHTWTFMRDSHDVEGYLAVLENEKPQRIIYCATGQFGFTEWLKLAQALSQTTSITHVDILTHQAQQVSYHELPDAEQCLLLGAAPVFAQEYPHITLRCIDIAAAPFSVTIENDKSFVTELLTTPEYPFVAFRGQRRWIQAFAPVAPPNKRGLPLRTEGVYLITGGLGRIGRTLARYLVEQYQAKLILTSRTGLPPRPEWTQWLTAANETSERIRFVQEMEDQGAKLHLFVVDAADPIQMEALFREVEQSFGALHGVLHLAAVTNDEIVIPIPEIDMAQVQRLLRPKVEGTQLLANLLTQRQMDFCVLFSSTAAQLGGLGFTVYAAANRFMDGMAQAQKITSRTPWLSINWDGWQFAGNAPGKIKQQQLGQIVDSVAMTPDEGVEVFINALCLHRLPQVIVSPGDWQDRYETWVMGAVTSVSEHDVTTPTVIHERPQLPTSYVAPRSDTEARLADIWQTNLGIKQIGTHDDYFELGGHSLLATQLTAKIRQVFNCEISVRQLFEAPTIAALAQVIDQPPPEETIEHPAQPMQMITMQERARSSEAGVQLTSRSEPIPLSFAQERLWFLHHLEPENPAYHLSFAVRCQGKLDITVFQRCITEVAHRHEAFRTTFATIENQPVQIITATPPDIVTVIDLRTLPTAAQKTAVQEAIQNSRVQPFDLESGPLWRFSLIRLEDDETIISVTVHHIVSDGWSTAVFIGEMETLYAAFVQGKRSPLPELALQYADFAHWQRQWLQGMVLQQQLSYWQKQLEGAPRLLPLPTDYPRPAMQTFNGDVYHFSFSDTLLAQIQSFGKREKASPFMLLLAALQLLLSRYSGQTDISVGTYIANRNREETRHMIGYFVNTLVLRTDLAGNPTFQQLLQRVRSTTLDAYAHQDIPFEKLLEELQPERALSHTPFFQTALVLQNTPTPVFDIEGLQFEPIPLAQHHANYDLTLWIEPEGESWQGKMEYNTDLFAADTIHRLVINYLTLLEAALAKPATFVSDLPLVTKVEQQQLTTWNERTQLVLPSHPFVHTWFTAQTMKTPDKTAVIYGAQSITYGELEQRANQLAYYLRQRGVGPDVFVGLYLPRSLDAVISMLAVLKAGGAYVPLDPAYPQERIAWMLADTQLLLLLTHRSLTDKLPLHQATHVYLDEAWTDIAAILHAAEPPQVPLHPDNLAYLTYTSGSTGHPKGVMATHKTMLHYLAAIMAAFELAPSDRVLQFAPLSFDATVEEIYPALLCGATVVLKPEEMIVPGRPFHDLIEQFRITVLSLPVAFWQEWIIAAKHTSLSMPASLRMVWLNAESPSPKLFAEAVRLSEGRIKWFNTYGPTETTVTAALFQCSYQDDQPWHHIPIGYPLANTKLYILDSNLQPVPVGVVGELYIGGSGVGRGYLNRPALTAERFLPDPFSGTPGARLYQTGDRARYLPDGKVVFWGRSDDQVKIRGFRIEPGEIKAVLDTHPLVDKSFVTIQTDQEAPCLAAYIVASPTITGDQTNLKETLTLFLAGKLPKYMIPTMFMQLDAFPLTPNGKINKAALPIPDHIQVGSTNYVAPRDAVELHLVQIWEDLLSVNPVGVKDSFFDLGGHSLLALRLMSRIQQASNQYVPLSALMQEPTIEALAAVLRQDAEPPASSSPLLLIKRGEINPPIYGIHAVEGNALFYHNLSRHLVLRRPFYGIEAVGLNGRQKPFATVEEMAFHYITHIRQQQPEGPYWLVGYCFGGLVAYEMAQQLHQQGETVELLALLDTTAQLENPFARIDLTALDPTGDLLTIYLALHVAAELAGVPWHFASIQYIHLSTSSNFSRNVLLEKLLQQAKAHQLVQLTVEQCLQLPFPALIDHIMKQGLALAKSRQTVPVDIEIDYMYNILRVRQAVENAELRYTLEPYLQTPYPGHTILFRAVKHPSDQAYDLGWSSLLSGKFEIMPVPGDHVSMITDADNARVLAHQLQRYLDLMKV